MAKRQLKVKNSKLIVYLKQNALLLLGLFLMSIFFVWKYHQSRILSFNSKEITRINSTDIKPIHIKAYPVGIDIDINPAVIIDGVWPVFPNSAGFITNGKNVIIYGHNKNNIFGPIRYIKLGAIVEILDSNNKIHKYEVVETDTVYPDNLEYIKEKKEETLTLYTCVGFFDSKRFIVVAVPVK